MEGTQFYNTESVVDNFDHIDKCIWCMLYFDTVSIKGQFQPQRFAAESDTNDCVKITYCNNINSDKRWIGMWYNRIYL
jgi:hypothetical protein